MALMTAVCRVINMLNYTAHLCNPEGGSLSQRMLGDDGNKLNLGNSRLSVTILIVFREVKLSQSFLIGQIAMKM